MTKDEILNKAIDIVTKDRQNDYGEAEDNFGIIADYMNVYLKERPFDYKISNVDVAVMMIFVKIARIQSGHHKDDNWIDIAGYAACGGEISDRNNS